ncbi:outer membrane protein TOM13-domain-containing protein [Massariosphaeria phaeospora]|uniref:Outer membrane protein TOM13-domain-containing protein n=1 Tax=Massariosphaeria phaeospora TaxID=100035 RepID=A0A7C8MNI9_9PLEO|nr:outer membrane protein TOM13-domain-containing protein [Massariosphaeria phaeospora]
MSSPLTSSGITMPSDSEPYDDASASASPRSRSASPSRSPPSPSSTPLILYKPPTFWGLARGTAINLLLPFINGVMLGFGELVAHELAFRLGWSGTKIFPSNRSETGSHAVGPGVEMRADPVERRRRNGQQLNSQELDALTSLE